MEKIILTLMIAFSTLTVNAQSFQLHQSYNDNGSQWGSTRFISDYFWTNDIETVNIFSWNSFSEYGISALLYGEYRLGNSNFFAHAEARAQFGNFEYSSATPQIGFAYLLPFDSRGVFIYLTPKYSYNDVYNSLHDIQESVNSSFEGEHVYYEGYIDTNYIKGFNIFAEQKAYYKLTNRFQLGACAVISGNSDGGHCQPYVSLRVSLY